MGHLKYGTGGHLIYGATHHLGRGRTDTWPSCDMVRVFGSIYQVSLAFFYDHDDGDERHYVINATSDCGFLAGQQACGQAPNDQQYYLDNTTPSTELKIHTVNKTVWFNYSYHFAFIMPFETFTETASWLGVEPTTKSSLLVSCNSNNYRRCEYGVIVNAGSIWSDCAHTSQTGSQDIEVDFFFLV